MPPQRRTNDDMDRVEAWADIFKGLMKEHQTKQATLAAAAQMNPASLHNFLNGEAMIALPALERALEFFGYELEAVKIAPAQPVATRCTEKVV